MEEPMAEKGKSPLLKIAGLVAIILSLLQLLFFINQLLIGINLAIPNAVLIITFVGIILSAALMLVLGIVHLLRKELGGGVLLFGSLSLFCFELLYFIMLRGPLSENIFGTQIVIPFGMGLALAGVFLISGILALVLGISRRHSPAGYWGLLAGLASILQLLFFIIIFIPMLTSGMGGAVGDQKVIQGCQANQHALEEGMKLYMEMEYLPLHPNATPDEILKAAQAIDLTFDGFKVMVGGKEIHYGSSKPETFACPGNKKSRGWDYKVTGYMPAANGKLGTFKVECQFDPKHNLPPQSK
jgi:hypothetical protein